MLKISQDLELQRVIQNRVNLWRLRSTNPLRRSYTRRLLTFVEAKALVVIACHLARRLTVLIRQLLFAYQQLREKQLPLEHHYRLSEYLERFRAHFRSRMNPRRAAVAIYNSDDKLLFCTGTSGMQRFWSSLFDGEV
jgi:hypothetical protein